MATAAAEEPVRAMVAQFCIDCHDRDVKKGDLDLESINSEALTSHLEIWEKVIRRLRARQMPPAGKTRPDESAYDDVVARLASSLDSAGIRIQADRNVPEAQPNRIPECDSGPARV
jgi:hypothetical protein